MAAAFTKFCLAGGSLGLLNGLINEKNRERAYPVLEKKLPWPLQKSNQITSEVFQRTKEGLKGFVTGVAYTATAPVLVPAGLVATSISSILKHLEERRNS